MDELDKILLQHLPDTGLCERSKVKQAQRRRNLKLAILGYMMNQARNPNVIVTKEGGTISGFMEAQRIGCHSPELAIDEMQFDQQEAFAKGGTIKGNNLALIGKIPDTSKEHVLTEEQMRKVNNFLKQ